MKGRWTCREPQQAINEHAVAPRTLCQMGHGENTGVLKSQAGEKGTRQGGSSSMRGIEKVCKEKGVSLRFYCPCQWGFDWNFFHENAAILGYFPLSDPSHFAKENLKYFKFRLTFMASFPFLLCFIYISSALLGRTFFFHYKDLKAKKKKKTFLLTKV